MFYLTLKFLKIMSKNTEGLGVLAMFSKARQYITKRVGIHSWFTHTHKQTHVWHYTNRGCDIRMYVFKYNYINIPSMSLIVKDYKCCYVYISCTSKADTTFKWRPYEARRLRCVNWSDR